MMSQRDVFAQVQILRHKAFGMFPAPKNGMQFGRSIKGTCELVLWGVCVCGYTYMHTHGEREMCFLLKEYKPFFMCPWKFY